MFASIAAPGFTKGANLKLQIGPSLLMITFNEWADRAIKRGAINNMQSTILDVPLSSKEMCNIIENDEWKRLGVSRSVFHYPVLNDFSSTLSKPKFPKICAFVRKNCQHVLFYSIVAIRLGGLV